MRCVNGLVFVASEYGGRTSLRRERAVHSGARIMAAYGAIDPKRPWHYVPPYRVDLLSLSESCDRQ
jgi:hypothetical protein